MKWDEFIAALRTALMQLDDLQSLRSNLLLPLIDAQGQPSTPVHLQRILLDAIDNLQNDAEVPLPLAYDILNYRYVEQMGQSEVAFQLGMSVRQLRRYQNNAIEYLADRLCQHPDVNFEPGHAPIAEQEMVEEASDTAATGVVSGEATFDEEIAWMQKSFPVQVSRIDIELTKALEEVSVLARHFAVEVQLVMNDSVLTTAIPPTVLRQTLMTVLTAVITRSAEHSFLLRITAIDADRQIEAVLQQISSEPMTLDKDFWASIHTTSQLLQPFEGQVCVDADAPLRIRLTMPVEAGVPILVVDDNDDVRYLYGRYAARSRFHIIDTGNSAEVISLVQQFRPAAIVMDIMMPEMDGWELLAHLRRHPLTAEIPVLICTILPQADLSQYLGATAFIQKPVSQQAFLSALDRLLASP